MRNIMNLFAACMIATSCSKTQTTTATTPHAYVDDEDVVLVVSDVEVWTQTEPTVVVADVVTCAQPPQVCKTDDELTDFYLPVSFYDDETDGSDGSDGVVVVLPAVPDVVDPLDRQGPEFPDVQ